MAGERAMERLHIPETAGSIRSDWGWSVLEQMCVGIFDCPHSTPEYTEYGPVIARSQDVRSGVFQVERAAHVSTETYTNRIARAEPTYGDLLYSREGTYFGIAAEVPRSIGVCLGQRMVLIRPDPKVLHFRYLKYWLNSPCLQAHINGHRDGSVAERLNLPTIRRLPVPVPPVWEQHAIAHILGTLDDKIELNRRTNETLEAMARALFKSWFVDFEPVRAKAEGRDTGLPKYIADLFPDRFQDSELGEIPEGWRIQTIGDLADVVGGSTPSTVNPTFWSPEQYSWATPKDLSSLKSPVLLHTERSVSDFGLSQIASGLLPVGTVLLSSRAPIGYLAIAEIPVAINQGFIAMKTKTGVSNLFLALWARCAYEEIISRANGSTFLEISKTNFRPIPLVAPPTLIFGAFDGLVQPLYRRIVVNECESITLSALRDSLLPKLLSGEIPVKDAEKFVEGQL